MKAGGTVERVASSRAGYAASTAYNRAKPAARELRGAGQRAGQLARDAGGGELVGGVGDTVLYGLRIMLGLALVYFVLTPRGSKALTGVLGMVTTGVQRFIEPVDPLRPASANAPAAADPTSDNRFTYDKNGDPIFHAERARTAPAPAVQSPSGSLGVPPIGGFPHPTINTP